MMRGLVIATNGDMRVQTFTAPALEDVQKVVGGYVETVPVRNIEGHYLLMVDEDSAPRGRPPSVAEARCQRGCQLSGLHEDLRHCGSDQRLRPGTGPAR